MLIILLTVFEISLTLLSVFEISKGAKFHQLNSLHLKYSGQFSERVLSLDKDSFIEVAALQTLILKIRQQPVDCLQSVNFLNKFIMKQIGTYNAVELCVKDIEDADLALLTIAKFANQSLSQEMLISELKIIAQTFNTNSALFEKPITETVSFVMKNMIPLVVIISLFNILFIIFMSRTITGSIRSAIALLESTNNEKSFAEDISKNVSGELKTLLQVAQKRLANEVLITAINQDLEKSVEQRTESLTRANSELAQFAYRTSHDLKAPLTASKLLTRFIIKDIQAGEIDNAIADTHRIHAQMEKLEDLVVSILSLTEADSLEPHYCDINLDQVMDDIQQGLSASAILSDCLVLRELECPLFSDKTRITQILENLISNSMKYKDQTKHELPYVRVMANELPDTYQLTVADNGVGIPQDRHKEVFHMFKRFHPKLSFGSGLGLAIVKKHVDYLQGKITMNTSKGGTTFVITIPKLNTL
jgi:signal transduction histidine kinase